MRLPQTYWCYQPHYEDIPVAPPSQNSSSITFGCLNTYSKVNPDVLSAWAAILRNVPGSRLIVHSLPGAHRQRDRALLEREGVDPNRLEFVGFLRGQEYFHQYYYIDVALDPFPYPGGTTTCDALWMGVPVVSLAGQTAVSRAGSSILSNIGLNELVATTAARYVEIASTLAHDVSRLAFLRSTLRDRMRSSPIMDQRQFARDVEAAYRQMWQSFCDNALPARRLSAGCARRVLALQTPLSFSPLPLPAIAAERFARRRSSIASILRAIPTTPAPFNCSACSSTSWAEVMRRSSCSEGRSR